MLVDIENNALPVLFGFYSNEPYQFIDKSEMDEIILKTEGNVVEELAELFKDVRFCKIFQSVVFKKLKWNIFWVTYKNWYRIVFKSVLFLALMHLFKKL